MKKYRKYISYRQLQWSNSKFVNILSDGTVQSVKVEEEVPSFSVSVPAPSNVTMAVPPRFLSSTVAGLSKRPRSESDEDSPSSSVSYPATPTSTTPPPQQTANDSNSPQVTPPPTPPPFVPSVSPFVLAATPTLSDITFTPTKEPILSNTVVTESASESPAEDLDDLRRKMRLQWGAWGLGVRYIL